MDEVQSKAQTLEHLQNPRIGDRFTELGIRWFHVIHEKPVILEEYAGTTPQINVPKDRSIVVFKTTAEFAKKYNFLMYVDRGAPLVHVATKAPLTEGETFNERLNKLWIQLVATYNELDLLVSESTRIPKAYLQIVTEKIRVSITEVEQHLGTAPQIDDNVKERAVVGEPNEGAAC